MLEQMIEKIKCNPLKLNGIFNKEILEKGLKKYNNSCSWLLAEEQKARATYEKLIDLCRDNPDVLDPLRYLREREVVHFQRFGEALRGVQDKLAERKFYMNDMHSMNTNMSNNNNCGCGK